MAALSIDKLRPGAEAYQLSGVAEGLDAYYTGAGEMPGQWVGGGADALGLSGEVDGDSLRAVLAGLDPVGGGLTPDGRRLAARASRVPGFDLTFKAPKSVSVLFAVSDDPGVQGAILDAGEVAAGRVVEWLENEAVRVRRGSNNEPWKASMVARGESVGHARMRHLPTGGLVGAAFRHRTSRAGDPFLHWHMLVANMAQGPDGRWTSIVHPELYLHGKAAGEVFQAVMRDELTRSLGLSWRDGSHVREVAGVPESIMRTFSKRRAEIEAYLEATGTPGDSGGSEQAALATRRSKGEQEHQQGLHERWRDEAIEAGWGPERAAEVVGVEPRRGPEYDDGVWRQVEQWPDENGEVFEVERLVDAEEWISDVLRRELTVGSTTFGRPEITQAVAGRLGAGATLETIGRVVDRFVASTQVVPVGGEDGSGPTRRGQHYTSVEMLGVEDRFIESLQARTVSVDAGHVERAIDGRPTIGDDQAEAVIKVTTTTAAVSVIIGPAGTGKTFALDAVRDAYEAGGWRVRGVSPSAKGAGELTAGSGIAASTMHSMQLRLLAGFDKLDSSDLLVVDEAGMADIRILEWLTTYAVEAGAKVVLVGDHRQLPEVGAGGGFAFAAANAVEVAKLTRNRRQRQSWEVDALNHLRDGSVPLAVESYHIAERVQVLADNDAMVEFAVEQWEQTTLDGGNCVLVAGTNEAVRRLNLAVVDRLVETGRLVDEPAVFGSDLYWPGQQLIIRTNYVSEDRQTTVSNGESGSVVSVSEQAITILRDDMSIVTLDNGYLAKGGQLDHGYARTIHRTQGGTWDRAIAVGLDGLWREGAYTALSRGRNDNLIVVTDPEWAAFMRDHERDLDRHDRGLRRVDEEPPAPTDAIQRQFSKRRGKQLAHAIDDAVTHISEAATLPLTEIRGRAAKAHRNEQVATDTIGATWQDLQARRSQLERISSGLIPGARVRVGDRNNLGTVLFLDHDEPVADVHFVAPNGREAIKKVDWSLLDPIEAAANVPDRVGEWTHQRLTVIERRLGDWEQLTRQLGSEPGDYDRYQRAASIQIGRDVAYLAAEAPPWLIEALGPRPANPIGASVWDASVELAAEYRCETGLRDASAAIGPRPDNDGDQAQQWDNVWVRLEHARRWIVTHHEHSRPHWPVVPPRGELLERQTRLERLFAQAPPDQRKTIKNLIAGQQTFNDVHAELEHAQSTQRERQLWILDNWPYVVEAAEIERALQTGATGPDVDSITHHLTTTATSDALGAAVSDSESWLAAAINHICGPEQTELGGDAVDWLDAVAHYRQTLALTTRDPLGLPPTNPDDNTTYRDLTAWGDRLHDSVAKPAIELQDHIGF